MKIRFERTVMIEAKEVKGGTIVEETTLPAGTLASLLHSRWAVRLDETGKPVGKAAAPEFKEKNPKK